MTENVIAEAAELSTCRLHDRVLRWSRLVSSHRLRLPAITIEQRSRHRTGASRSDRPIVDLHDRHDLARGAGEKRLVRAEQILVAQRGFSDDDSGFAADLEQELARDPWQ